MGLYMVVDTRFIYFHYINKFKDELYKMDKVDFNGDKIKLIGKLRQLMDKDYEVGNEGSRKPIGTIQ